MGNYKRWAENLGGIKTLQHTSNVAPQPLVGDDKWATHMYMPNLET